MICAIRFLTLVISLTLVPTGFLVADADPFPQISMTESVEQDIYLIHGAFDVSVDQLQTWKVLSDYERLQGILSNLRSSKVLERDLNNVLVEQVLDGQFLFVHREVRLRLQIRETAPWRIEFKQAENHPFRHYDGFWTIEPQSHGCNVNYNLAVSRGDMAPKFLERRLFRDSALNLLRKLQEEVIRRSTENRIPNN